MILEAIVTSLDSQEKINVAPMGPVVEESLSRFVLKPFRTSQTLKNLKSHPEGVIHIVDNVLLLAKAAIGRVENPSTFPAEKIRGFVLEECCRWFEFRVLGIDDSQERAVIDTEVVHEGFHKHFFGLNRAKHAVVEAAILMTRLHLLPKNEIETEMKQLLPLVEKTGGVQEKKAWQLLEDYFAAQSETKTSPIATNP